MTVTLLLLKPNSVPFDDYPQLKTIWPANFQLLAEKITSEELGIGPNDGPILLILENQQVVGITGAFVWEEDTTMMGLRWTGVIPSRRRSGIAKHAIDLLISYLAETGWECRTLVELLPDDEYGDSMRPFFEKTGFKKCGSPVFYEWLGCNGHEYCLEVVK